MITTSIRIRRAAAAGAAALAVGAAAAPSATAAPLPAPQLPAQGILSQGIGAWSGYSAVVRIETAGPGAVWLSAPGGDACRRGAEGTLVRVDFTNPGALRSGSGTVRPCPGPFSGPLRAKLYTGPGRVVGVTTIVTSGGPWQLPGVATFGVPG